MICLPLTQLYRFRSLSNIHSLSRKKTETFHRILICSKIRSLVFLSKAQVEAEVKDRERKDSLQNLNLNLDIDLLRPS